MGSFTQQLGNDIATICNIVLPKLQYHYTEYNVDALENENELYDAATRLVELNDNGELSKSSEIGFNIIVISSRNSSGGEGRLRIIKFLDSHAKELLSLTIDIDSQSCIDACIKRFNTESDTVYMRRAENIINNLKHRIEVIPTNMKDIKETYVGPSTAKSINESYRVDEGKKADKKTLIFLSARAAKKCADTSLDIFEKQAKKKGYDFFCLNPEFTNVDDNRDNEYVFTLTDTSNDTQVICDIRNTIIIPRRSAIASRESCDLLKLLKFHGFFLVNTLDVFLTCEDKFETYRVLSNAHIDTPDTILCPKKNVQKALDKASQWGYPIVGKLPCGTQGIGVFIMDSPNSALSVLQAMTATTDGVILQRFINSKCDYRVHVLNNSYSELEPNYEVIGMMRRTHTNEDFRSNYHLGASVEIVNDENTDPNTIKQIEDIAIAAAKSVHAVWCGVDVIVSEDNKFYVIEINSSPGTTGITSAGGTPVDSIMNFFDKFEWISTNNIAGCIETMDIVVNDDTRLTCNMGLSTDDICTIFYDSFRMIPGSDQAEIRVHAQDKPIYVDITGSTNKGAKTAYMNISFNHTKYKYVPVVLVDASSVKQKYDKEFIKGEVPVNPMEKNGFKLSGIMGSPFVSRANVCISTEVDHIVTDDVKNEK